PGGLRHVGERSMSVATRKMVGRGVVGLDVRSPVRTTVDENVEVRKSVAVVVDSGGGGGVIFQRDTRLSSSFLERPVPPIAIEKIRAVQIRHIEIRLAVVVVVEGEGTHGLPLLSADVRRLRR